MGSSVLTVRKKGAFFTIKELWSPIVASLPRQQSPATVTIAIENRYSFTDTRQCRFTWELRRFHGPADSSGGFVTLAHGEAKAPRIAPGHTGTLGLRLPPEETSADALALRVQDPFGRELWTWVWPLPGLERFHQVAEAPRSGAGADHQDPGNAGSDRWRSGGHHQPANRLAPGRQTPDEHLGADQRSAARRRPGEPGTTQVPGGRLGGPSSRPPTAVICNPSPGKCAPTAGSDAPIPIQPQDRGSSTAFALTIRRLRCGRSAGWARDPFGVWKNRLRGTTLGVWETDYNQTATGWSHWLYPEFKGCFAGVRWLALDTTEGPLLAILGDDHGYVQVLTPDFPPANLQARTALHLPESGLAFLDGIPPHRQQIPCRQRHRPPRTTETRRRVPTPIPSTSTSARRRKRFQIGSSHVRRQHRSCW